MRYDLEIERVKREIKKRNAKKVCLQLAEGLKPEATKIADELKDVEVLIWADSCFGACDYPMLDVDLLIQFGHSERW